MKGLVKTPSADSHCSSVETRELVSQLQNLRVTRVEHPVFLFLGPSDLVTRGLSVIDLGQ